MSEMHDKPQTNPKIPSKGKVFTFNTFGTVFLSTCLCVTVAVFYSEKQASADLRKEIDNIRSRLKVLEQSQEVLNKSIQDRADELDERVTKTEGELKRVDIQTGSAKRDMNDIKGSWVRKIADIEKCIETKINSLSAKIDGQEKCQSGLGVGVHTYPQHSFPYSVTVRFDPPFGEVPAFAYGTTLFDSTKFTHYYTTIDTLTNEMFTLSINTWGGYNLWGARISWMACPRIS